MCGLFGYIGTKPNKSAIALLGTINESRGTDSWGVYIHTKEHNQIYKGLDFFSGMTTDIQYPDGLCTIIGHTRAKTAGAVNVQNAHPFDLGGGWVGAKNGTVSNWKALCEKYKVDTKDIEVDSHGFMKSILVDFPNQKVLSEYEGGACITMSDTIGEIWLFRGATEEKYGKNKGKLISERPLFLLKTDDGVYWSSLKYSLQYISLLYQFGAEPEEFDMNKLVRMNYLGKEVDSFDIDRSYFEAGIVTASGNMNSKAPYSYSYGYGYGYDTYKPGNILEEDYLNITEYNGFIYWAKGCFRVSAMKAHGFYYVNRDTGEWHKQEVDNTVKCYFYQGVYVSKGGYDVLSKQISTSTIWSGRMSNRDKKSLLKNTKKYCLFPFSVGLLTEDKSKELEYVSSDKDGYPNEVEITPFAREVELIFESKGKLKIIDDGVDAVYDEDFFINASLEDLKKVPQNIWDAIDLDSLLYNMSFNPNPATYDFVYNKVSSQIDDENFGSVQTNKTTSPSDVEQDIISEMSDEALEKELESLVDLVIAFSNESLVGEMFENTSYKDHVSNTIDTFLANISAYDDSKV